MDSEPPVLRAAGLESPAMTLDRVAQVDVAQMGPEGEPGGMCSESEGHAGTLRRDGVGHSARRGALWTASSVLLLRFANIAVMAVVARLVAPEQLGVFTVALTMHAFVASVAELGVASAVARSDLDPERLAPTVATLSIATSAVLATAMFLAAQPLADLLGSPDAASPLRVLSLTVLLIGPFAVPGAQLQREFRQKTVFIATVVSFPASSAVLLILAAVGDGAMAFAWSRVVGTLISGAVVMMSVSSHYRPGFRREELAGLLRFGLPLAAANLLSQILLNVDYVFVARTLGAEQLGFYALAFSVASWSTSVLGSMLNGVVLPAFSAVKQRPDALPRAMRKATRSVALVACPIALLTLALARPVIVTVYGEKWSVAAPALQVLSLYGLLFVLCLLLGNIIIAMGRTAVLLGVQLVGLVVLLPSIALGINWSGLVGVGAAHVFVMTFVILPAYLVAIRRSTGVGSALLARAAAPPALAAGVGACVAFAVTSVLAYSAPAELLIAGTAGGAVYCLLILPLLPELLPERALRLRVITILLKSIQSIGSRLKGGPVRADENTAGS